jgi:hypothetical protein
LITIFVLILEKRSIRTLYHGMYSNIFRTSGPKYTLMPQLSQSSQFTQNIPWCHSYHRVANSLSPVIQNLGVHSPKYTLMPQLSQSSQFNESCHPESKCTVYSYSEIRVITKLPNSEQSYKGKVKTHNYINRQIMSTTGKLWKP